MGKRPELSVSDINTSEYVLQMGGREFVRLVRPTTSMQLKETYLGNPEPPTPRGPGGRLNLRAGDLAHGLTLLFGLVALFAVVASVRKSAPSSAGHHIEVLHVPPADSGKALTAYGNLAAYLEMKLRHDLSSEGYQVSRRTVAGSLETLALLDSVEGSQGDVVQRIGLAQSDVVYHYLTGNHPSFLAPPKGSSVRAIGRVFSEWLHVCSGDVGIVARRSAPSADPLLHVREFCIGRANLPDPFGTGHLVTAMNLSRVLGLPWERFDVCPVLTGSRSGTQASSDVLRLDVTSPQVSPSATSGQVCPGEMIVGLSRAATEAMSAAVPGIYRGVGSKEILLRYPQARWLSERNTIAVDAVLVASKVVDRQVISTLKRAINDLDSGACVAAARSAQSPPSAQSCRSEIHADDPEACGRYLAATTDACDVGARVPEPPKGRFSALLDKFSSHMAGQTRLPLGRVMDLPIARHPADVIDDLPEVSYWIATVATFRSLQFAVAALVICIGASRTWRRIAAQLKPETRSFGILRSTRKAILVNVGLVAGFLLFHVLIGVAIFVGELYADSPQRDDDFVRLGAGHIVWWVFEYIMLEAPRQFVSPMAIASVGLLKGGWALAGVVLSIDCAEGIRAWRRRSRLSRHVIVIGWNEIGPEVVRELVEQNIPRIVCTFDDKVDAEAFKTTETEHHVVGSAKDALAKGQWKRAQACIVLADRKRAEHEGESDVDTWVCRTVEEIACGRSVRTPAIIAQVLRSDHVAMIKRVGATEAICAESFGLELLAHAMTKPGLVNVLGELLHTRRQGCELYLDEIHADDRRTWVSFEQCRSEYDKRYQGELRRIPIGVLMPRANGDIVRINPEGVLGGLTEEDKLIVIARDPLPPATA